MRKRRIENDPLERLFAAARERQVPDGGFTERVVGRIEPVPPSRNVYRIPTFATAFASVLLIVWLTLSGFDLSGLTNRLERLGEGAVGGGVRLMPTTWKIPHVENPAVVSSHVEP